jgi:NTP pyrophosphatase (non-canonical NTP hydrolase)
MNIENAQKQVDDWIKEHGVRYFNELTNMAQLTEEVGEVVRIIARRYGEQSEKLSALISDFGIRQFLMKNLYWKEKGQLGYRFNLESLTNNNPEVGDALPYFTIFEKDTLFLKGEKSDYITENEIPIIEAHFPTSKIVKIANGGH